jgi:DnaJ-like protein
MAPDADPYRTLGLGPDASLDDVKRAYRRLAKANHPDAAGESALPRFLAIQAAYDQIAGPDARIRRPGGPGSAGARRAWEADPTRAGATHRAYGGRSRTRPGPRPRPSAGPPGSPGSPGSSTDGRTGRPPRPDRPPNKATLGSTSYDGADAEPLDPDWGGASWYGTSSGTYWTLNPKEYADPRKHGPEYQARARRADLRRAGMRAPVSETLASAAGPEDAEAPDDANTPEGPQASPEPAEASHETAEPATHTASSWWQSTPTEPAARAAAPAEAVSRARSPRTPPPAGPPRSTAAAAAGADGEDVSTEAVLDSIRRWIDDRRPGVGARVGRAVIGWAPIALGIGWFAGEISGCGRFSADCHPAVAPISWAAQLLVLALLIAVTRLARITTIATIATLAAIFPASALLLATFDPEGMTAGRTVLGGLMATAWIAGIVYGVAREVRRRPVDPVS